MSQPACHPPSSPPFHHYTTIRVIGLMGSLLTQVWHANLTEYPLVMDTTLENGPRSMLFDLCKVR